MTNEIKFGKCPRCNTTCDMTRPSLSRRDNKTEICSGCGGDEALFDAQQIITAGMAMREKAWLKKEEE